MDDTINTFATSKARQKGLGSNVLLIYIVHLLDTSRNSKYMDLISNNWGIQKASTDPESVDIHVRFLTQWSGVKHDRK